MTRSNHPALPVSCLLAALFLTACIVTDDPTTCGGCHRDCGWGRPECDLKCDAKPMCSEPVELNDTDEEGAES